MKFLRLMLSYVSLLLCVSGYIISCNAQSSATVAQTKSGHEYMRLRAPMLQCAQIIIAPRESRGIVYLQAYYHSSLTATPELIGNIKITDPFVFTYDFASFTNKQAYYSLQVFQKTDAGELVPVNINEYVQIKHLPPFWGCPWSASSYGVLNMGKTLLAQQVIAGVAAAGTIAAGAGLGYYLKKRFDACKQPSLPVPLPSSNAQGAEEISRENVIPAQEPQPISSKKPASQPKANKSSNQPRIPQSEIPIPVPVQEKPVAFDTTPAEELLGDYYTQFNKLKDPSMIPVHKNAIMKAGQQERASISYYLFDKRTRELKRRISFRLNDDKETYRIVEISDYQGTGQETKEYIYYRESAAEKNVGSSHRDMAFMPSYDTLKMIHPLVTVD